MTWGDDEKKPANPVFHGGKDRTTANKMLRTLGGSDGFRQRIDKAPDGTVTTLRTKNGMPQVEVAPPKPSGYVWAWPWHGLVRCEDNVIETPTGDIPLRGANPISSPFGEDSFNCIYTRMEGASEFLEIPPPTRSPKGSVWVNYATISNGVLFGEYVGMNVWLYCTKTAVYVVELKITQPTLGTITNPIQCIIKIYTLDNWVFGAPVELAKDFVRYDKPPHPFMVRARPSGVARTPLQTITLSAPAYYREPLRATMRLKRGDVSYCGNKIILAYEVSGMPTTGEVVFPGDPYTGASTYDYMVEDQWAEITLTSDPELAATVELIKSGAAGPSHRFDNTSYNADWTKGYMYSPSGEVGEVLEKVVSRQEGWYNFKKTSLFFMGLENSYDTNLIEVPRYTDIYGWMDDAYRSLLVAEKEVGTGFATGIFNLVSGTDPSPPSGWGEQEWSPETGWDHPIYGDTTQDIRNWKVNGYSEGTAYAHRPSYEEMGVAFWLFGDLHWGDLASNFPGRCAYYNLSYQLESGAFSGNDPMFVAYKHSFNTYLLSTETFISGYHAGYYATGEAHPRWVLTPYGCLYVQDGGVTPEEFTKGCCIDVIGLSKTVFDENGHADAGELIKYATLNAGVNKTRRYI